MIEGKLELFHKTKNKSFLFSLARKYENLNFGMRYDKGRAI